MTFYFKQKEHDLKYLKAFVFKHFKQPYIVIEKIKKLLSYIKLNTVF